MAFNIEYKEETNKSSKVYLDGKHIGTIKRMAIDCWRYFPKGKTDGGWNFLSRKDCKSSLETEDYKR
jgi:hypothetical protein